MWIGIDTFLQTFKYLLREFKLSLRVIPISAKAELLWSESFVPPDPLADLAI